MLRRVLTWLRGSSGRIGEVDGERGLLEVGGVTVGAVGSCSVAALGAVPAASWGSARVVVADSFEGLAAVPPTAVGLVLGDLPRVLAVAAFDPASANPVGWRVGAGDDVVPPFGGSAVSRAGELAAAAARGIAVGVDGGDVELAACLGGELAGLLAGFGSGSGRADDWGREALSIAVRRAALRSHSRRARAAQLLAAASVAGSPWPTVTVLVATRRPDRLGDVAAQLARQTYPRLDVVVALHGEGFDVRRAEALLASGPHRAQFVAVPAAVPLGGVLNVALGAAEGDFVTKFDDDDEYSAEHVWDLVLAADYSGAAAVGKTSEYVWLAASDCTVRRFAGFGERFIDPQRQGLCGAASLLRRDAVESVGGWRPLGVGEDRAVVADIGASGGAVYRMHGSGFLAMRHGYGHTWDVADSYFLAQANETRPGCDRRFAGVA